LCGLGKNWCSTRNPGRRVRSGGKTNQILGESETRFCRFLFSAEEIVGGRAASLSRDHRAVEALGAVGIANIACRIADSGVNGAHINPAHVNDTGVVAGRRIATFAGADPGITASSIKDTSIIPPNVTRSVRGPGIATSGGAPPGVAATSGPSS
jgi:hypothetical protein